MNLLDLATERLADARANYETKLADAPDMRAVETKMANFRAEHAELKRLREADFLTTQRAAQAAIDLFRVEHAEEKRYREAEFTAAQISAKEVAAAKAELIRATRALAREEVTQAMSARRVEKHKAKADEEAELEYVRKLDEAYTAECNLKFPNAVSEREAREREAIERRNQS